MFWWRRAREGQYHRTSARKIAHRLSCTFLCLFLGKKVIIHAGEFCPVFSLAGNWHVLWFAGNGLLDFPGRFRSADIVVANLPSTIFSSSLLAGEASDTIVAFVAHFIFVCFFSGTDTEQPFGLGFFCFAWSSCACASILHSFHQASHVDQMAKN